MKALHLIAISLVMATSAAPAVSNLATTNPREWAPAAQAVLTTALQTESGWTQVHAAEALIALGQNVVVRDAMATTVPLAESATHRTGIWRVLAATASSPAERERYVEKIAVVFLDPASPDRWQALESLNKLHYAPTGDTLRVVRKLGQIATEADQVLALWSAQLAEDPEALTRIGARLSSPEPLARWRAAYALRWLHLQSPTTLLQLAQAAAHESPESPAFVYIVSAAYVLDADVSQRAAWELALQKIALNGAPNAQFEACQALGSRASSAVITELAPLLSSPAADTRIGAAWAVLSVGR